MKDQTGKSGLDDALTLDTVYYTGPMPQNLAVLTILGAVFDRVYFPGVYMPSAGFDQAELDKEIARIESLDIPRRPGDITLPMLKFIRHARTLDGFLCFTGDREKIFKDDRVPLQMVRGMYEAIHGPIPDGWEPDFPTNFTKGMPGSDECIIYPGTYHYLVGSVLESARTGLPLVNDFPGIPIPGLDGSVPIDDAKVLASIIAIECTKLVLPQLPMLRPEDLMEFRAENQKTLRTFRRSMLSYAADLNKSIATIKRDELEHKTKFFVQTEVVPVMDELQASINAPSREWWKRGVDFVKVIPELAAACFTLDHSTAIAKILTTYAGQMFVEMTARGDRKEALKRSGLYYLLKLRAFQEERR
jgi:hypothetical protein